MLGVNTFGIKRVNKNDVKHLVDALKDHYKVEIELISGLYCGIILE